MKIFENLRAITLTDEEFDRFMEHLASAEPNEALKKLFDENITADSLPQSNFDKWAGDIIGDSDV